MTHLNACKSFEEIVLQSDKIQANNHQHPIYSLTTLKFHLKDNYLRINEIKEKSNGIFHFKSSLNSTSIWKFN